MIPSSRGFLLVNIKSPSQMPEAAPPLAPGAEPPALDMPAPEAPVNIADPGAAAPGAVDPQAAPAAGGGPTDGVAPVTEVPAGS